MTIQEAIKTGKPFRRKSDVRKYGNEWYGYPVSRAKRQNVYPMSFNAFNDTQIIRDILAEDWEVKQ